jgi:hypothetical protein
MPDAIPVPPIHSEELARAARAAGCLLRAVTGKDGASK